MKKNLIFLILLIYSEVYAQKAAINKNGLNPDITVNNELMLLNGKSILRYIGDQKDKLIDDEKASRVQFKNVSCDEYLILYHLNGSNANSFNEFEIGLLTKDKKHFKQTNYRSFFSESNIHLGLKLKDLIKIKGSRFTKSNKDGFVVFKYKIENPDFLKQYNMPIYTAEYYFKNGMLSKFIFGFPNL